MVHVLRVTTGSLGGVDFSHVATYTNLAAGPGTVSPSATSSRYTATFTGFTIDVTGSGFTYDPDELPISGTMTRSITKVGGRSVIDISYGPGLKIAAINAGLDTFSGTGSTTAIDAVYGSSAWSMTGNSGNDILEGYSKNDTLAGGSGNDKLIGNAGNDILTGAAGTDTLLAGLGDDKLTGGAGRDTMTGGAGADDFIFNLVSETGKTATTRDVIKDFTRGIDDIDLKNIDANGSALGDPAFKFLTVKGAAFTGVKGQLRWSQADASGTSNDKTIIEGDIDGNKVADFQIELTGLKILGATDFIL